jgi:hypothetical protein
MKTSMTRTLPQQEKLDLHLYWPEPRLTDLALYRIAIGDADSALHTFVRFG